MRKGFLSLILVLVFAASLFAIISSSHSSEAGISSTSLGILRLEKDYYLRSSLREGMKSALASGEIQGLQSFAGIASDYYARQGISVSFWCAQSSERSLATARRWRLDETTPGTCINLLDRTARMDSANACSLLLSANPLTGSISIVRANSTRFTPEGEICTYPALAGSAPSVFAAQITYTDGNESLALLPEGTEVHHG